MKRLKLLLLLMSAGLLYAQTAGAASLPYDYPFVNPLQATVIGTPDAYRAEVPEAVPTRTYRIETLRDRPIPDLFWYQDAFEFSLAWQNRPAPLIFVIAGTGADYRSDKMTILQKALHQAGFHVIAISSPTAMNFIVTSAAGNMPGHPEEDARDLYRVMALALQKVRDRIDVTDFYLTGYSLGGLQAAFVAKLDEERRLFAFRKVLMINPPVSLYTSAAILDRLLVEHIPGGVDNFNAWFAELTARLAEVNRELGLFRMSGEDVLFQVYRRYPPTDEFLSALIGLSFRISAANLIFTADVMNGGGYIVPRGAPLTPYTPLTDYFIVAHRTGLTDYFHEFFYPRFRQGEGTADEQQVMAAMTLRAIEPYLRSSAKVGLFHNEDDIILAAGEIDWFRAVFGDRATIYPNGGHCGNLGHYANIADMIEFFSGKGGGK